MTPSERRAVPVRWPLLAALALATALGCAPGTFRHRAGATAARFLAARHVVIDTVTAVAAPATVRAAFSYGALRKDLEDEWVELRLLRAGRWEPVARAITNDDGWVELVVPGELLGEPGAHAVELVVEGDATKARGTVWVLERGSPIVIFDVDGTLTSGGFVRHALLGSGIQPRPGAAELARRHAEAGALPIYLTGRSYGYEADTRAWLDDAGFPRGPLVVASETASGFPWHRIAEYKQTWLSRLVAAVAPDVRAAYGDSESDVCAYAQAGIPPERTFLWGESSEPCPGHELPRPVRDYRSHLETLWPRP